MKICLVSLADVGGMVNYTLSIANELSKMNDVSVISPSIDYDLPNTNIKFYDIHPPKSYFSFRSMNSIALLKLINKTRPDIVHITSIHPWFIFILPILRLKYPIIITIHDVKMHLGEWNPIWALSSWISVKFAHKVFVHGKWAKEALCESGVASDKISIINLGNLSMEKEPKKLEETIDILFFGRIQDYKGLNCLIEAEKLLKKSIDNLKIVIAGEGDINKYIESITNSDSFEIHNKFIPEKEIPTLFSKAKIIVLPYLECTQTGIIPIAYSFKKPVVATNVGCIPEVVEDGKTGLLVNKNKPKLLAKAILKLLKNDNLRVKMGENGLNKLKKDLSWEKTIQEMICVYNEFI